MQFQIPQFIEEENKLFGPFTFKQFIYIAGGGGAIFIIWALIPWKLLAILLIIPVGILSALLAFKPINNRSFEVILEAAFHFFSRSKLYLWRREYRPKEPTAPEIETGERESSVGTKTVGSQLDELSWNIEIGNQKPRDRG